MPSCVVRCCKNTSMYNTKADGITFHKFPKDVVWKQKWLDVIRASRKEETWIPSKFSVVCSTHFADEDLYQTKFGLRRIKKDAIPKQYITRPKIVNDVPEEGSVPSSSNTESQHQVGETELDLCTCSPEAHYSDQNSTDDEVVPLFMPQPIFAMNNEPNSPEIYHSDKKSSEVQFEPSYTLHELITVKVKPSSPETHNLDNDNEMLIKPTTKTQALLLMKIEPDGILTFDRNSNVQSIDKPIKEANPRYATPSVNDSDIDSICDSPVERKLKRLLRKQMNLGEIQRKKIKRLNQKLQRLEKTNNRLHETIKMLTEKVQACQAVHIFQGPHSFWGAETERTETEGAEIEGAEIEGAEIEGAEIEGAEIEGAEMEVAEIEGAEIEGAEIEGAEIEGAEMEGAEIEGANLLNN